MPTSFFLSHLGPKLKYSSCEWPTTTPTNSTNNPTNSTNKFNQNTTLQQAETYTLTKYCAKLELSKLPSNSTVLEVGCGWGSLSLFMAEK